MWMSFIKPRKSRVKSQIYSESMCLPTVEWSVSRADFCLLRLFIGENFSTFHFIRFHEQQTNRGDSNDKKNENNSEKRWRRARNVDEKKPHESSEQILRKIVFDKKNVNEHYFLCALLGWPVRFIFFLNIYNFQFSLALLSLFVRKDEPLPFLPLAKVAAVNDCGDKSLGMNAYAKCYTQTMSPQSWMKDYHVSMWIFESLCESERETEKPCFMNDKTNFWKCVFAVVVAAVACRVNSRGILMLSLN